MHDLGAFTADGASVANDINAAGLVVGNADSVNRSIVVNTAAGDLVLLKVHH